MKKTVARLTTILRTSPQRSPYVMFLTNGTPLRHRSVAAAVAKELHLELLVVDLRQVVSKFIGETEKNLSRVFGEATRAGSLLFFDEADALFGKRTDVKDSHDRYGNTDTSYLLQRIEAHAGIVGIAVNTTTQADEIAKSFRRARTVVVSAAEDGDDD